MDLDRLRRIGWTHWNPIGLAGPPATPADEYDAYLSRTFGMLTAGQSEADVIAYLVGCAEVDMGVRPADHVAARTTVAALADLIETKS